MTREQVEAEIAGAREKLVECSVPEVGCEAPGSGTTRAHGGACRQDGWAGRHLPCCINVNKNLARRPAHCRRTSWACARPILITTAKSERCSTPWASSTTPGMCAAGGGLHLLPRPLSVLVNGSERCGTVCLLRSHTAPGESTAPPHSASLRLPALPCLPRSIIEDHTYSFSKGFANRVWPFDLGNGNPLNCSL